MTWTEIAQTLVVPVLVACLGGWWAFKQSKIARDRPSWKEMADQLTKNTERMDALNEDVDQERKERRSLETRVGVLERHESSWGYFYDGLTLRWPEHRTKDTPPPPPAHYRT